MTDGNRARASEVDAAGKIPLAPPWKRLAASATDVWVLFLAHLLVVAPIIYFVSEPESWLFFVRRASPIFCWAYFWWGWSRGQTPGKKWWRVRVVGADGVPMTPRRALWRIVGYMLASWPLKIGLLPILFDPLRRGLHDRFAQTLVLDARASWPTRERFAAATRATTEKARLSREAKIQPPVPDLMFARRGWPLVFALYLGLSVALTWPVASHFSTQLAGDGGDGWVFVWNLWWFQSALESGQSPLFTDALFFPNTVPLVFHTMNWFACALALPLQRWFSPVEAYNLLFLATPAWCALSAYFLAAALTQKRLAALLVAPVFGFSPFFMVHGQGHLNLLSAQFLPAFALAFYAMLATSRARYAAWAGVFLALAGACDFQFLLFGCLTGLVLFAGVHFAFAPPAPSQARRRVVLSVGALLGGLMLLLPLLLPAAREAKSAAYMNKSGQAAAFKADLSDFYRFGKLHPWNAKTGAGANSNENDLTPGIVVLAVCGLALSRAGVRRSLAPWTALGGVALVLACGPFLSWRGQSSWPSFVLIPLAGAPGNAFELPGEGAPMMAWAGNFAVSLSPTISTTSIALPFASLSGTLPLLKAFRVPARLGVLVLLACVPFAALGLDGLRRAASRQWGARVALALPAAFACLLLTEYLPTPYPTSEARVSPFDLQMRRDGGRYAVLNVPVQTSPRAMGAQTVHQKPILVGHISRCPPQAFTVSATNVLMRALSPHPFDVPGSSPPPVPSQPRDFGPALAELRRLPVRYVLLHKSALSSQQWTQYTALLAHLKFVPVYDDPDTRAYRFPP